MTPQTHPKRSNTHSSEEYRIGARSKACRNASLKRAGLILLLAALFATPMLSGCSEKKPADRAVIPEAGPMRVTLTAAQERNIGLSVAPAHPIHLTDWVKCDGQIQVAEPLQVQVFSPAPGRVMRFPVSLGQPVRQGQLLGIVKSDEIGQLESDLLQQTLTNEADLRQANTQLELSKAAYEREKQLYREAISSKADLEMARTQYRKDLTAREAIQAKNAANIQALRDRFSLYGVSGSAVDQVIRLRRIHPYLSLTAPHSGIVTERSINPGEMVDTGKPLLTISDLKTVWLVGDVYEKDIAKVKVGQPIHVTVDSLPGRVFVGHVHFLSSLLDPQTRTLKVRGVMANPDLTLKPHMFARMTIEVGSHTALAVPQTAVQNVGDSHLVYVRVAPNTFEERPVSLGRIDGPFVEVRSGLAEGETIAVQGTVSLKGLIIRKRGEIVAGGSGS